MSTTHMDEKDLHLCLCYSASDALARAKAEAQAAEVVALSPEPARGLILLWTIKHLGVSPHCIETYLHQGLNA